MSAEHLLNTSANRRKLMKASTGAMAAIGSLHIGGRVFAQNEPPGGSPPDGSGGGPEGGAPGGEGGSDTVEDFVGVTTDGEIESGLFAVEATGSSTAGIVDAATAFLGTLTAEQLAATQFAIDDDEWQMWSNVDGYQRQGTSFREMDDTQIEAAWGLLASSLSAVGYDKVDATIKLNHTEGELMNNFESFDEDLYWFTVMGEPSATEPWGWQIDGHHLVLNYFLQGDQLVMTPLFMGAEPTISPEGTEYAGISVMIPEQDKGLSFINALTEDQQAVAILSTDKSGENLQAGAGGDNAVIPYAGIVASEMDDAQLAQFLDLILEWVGNMPDDQAAIRMAEIQMHLDATYFSWVGDTGEDAVFYYRIQSPVILIEFDHQSPGPLGRSSDYYQGATGPNRAHVHSIVRTPNGNDYGKDLLAQHYATADHHQPSTLAGVAGVGLGAYGIYRAMLPPQYRDNTPVSSAPMGAADLIRDKDGNVLWDQTWDDFCHLALAGGPPHRGTKLQMLSLSAEDMLDPRYDTVREEIVRGLESVTGWNATISDVPGAVELSCPDKSAAMWLQQAITCENVEVRRSGNSLLFPARPEFRVDHEIRNVVTAVAKTHHYWSDHSATTMSANTR